MDTDTLKIGIAWYVVFIFSTCLHEASHALAALMLGDRTAYEGGQVTLDPRPHIRREPFGTIIAPLVSFFLMGWMIGWASAPYDPRWAIRFPRRAALMALAGPASNLLLVVLAGLAIHIGLQTELFFKPSDGISLTRIALGDSGLTRGLAMLLSILFSLNLVLFLFNLLPLPPLDGSAALPLVLPAGAARRYLEVMREPMFSILGIVVAWRLFGYVLWPVFVWAVGVLYA